MTPELIEKAMLYLELVERHLAGKHNQKTHGNKYGGFEATKESLRRLKGDKQARERYKQRARDKADKETLELISKPADRGFMGRDASFDEFIQSEKDIFGENSVKITEGKRGKLYQTGTSAYIQLDGRIIQGNSAFYTEKIFEKIQSDEGLREFLDSNREIAKFRKKNQK